MSRNATESRLGVTFHLLAPVEFMTVRRHDAYLGKLIRSIPEGPVWADPHLQRHIGGSLTVDGTMDEARAAVLARIAEGEESR